MLVEQDIVACLHAGTYVTDSRTRLAQRGSLGGLLDGSTRLADGSLNGSTWCRRLGTALRWLGVARLSPASVVVIGQLACCYSRSQSGVVGARVLCKGWAQGRAES